MREASGCRGCRAGLLRAKLGQAGSLPTLAVTGAGHAGKMMVNVDPWPSRLSARRRP